MVFHNGINFDIPVIRALVGLMKPEIEDTLIISKLMYTKDELFDIDRGITEIPGKLKGGYSLGAFGYRFGNYKLQFEDFSCLTTEMITYCKQDVDLTRMLYKHMSSQTNFPKPEILALEYEVARIIQTQERYGFSYDEEGARKLMVALRFRKMSLEQQLQRTFQPKFLPDGPLKTTNKLLKRKAYVEDKHYTFKCKVPLRFIHPLPRLKRTREDFDGNIFPVYKIPGKNKFKWFDKPHRIYFKEQLGEYQPIKFQKFNPGSRDQIKLWLNNDYGFKFSTFTEKGSRKVDGDELTEAFGESGRQLKSYLKTTKDLSEVVGVLEEYKPGTRSIHGRVDTVGAATHRCTHSRPNVAQTSADPIFRSFYTVPEGYKLVGADLANIEIRILAHYLAPYDKGKYAKAVLSQDMHWYHAKLAGFWPHDDREWPTDAEAHLRTPEMKEARAKSKGFFFGYLYGQGDTIRGHILWSKDCLTQYTEQEYNDAKKKVERRIVVTEGIQLFPLRKDQYVEYNELLILKTVYGKRIADTFLQKLTGIKELIDDCAKQSKEKGTVTAIDGRELYSRSPHSALNLLLQGSAGVVAKQWMVNYTNLSNNLIVGKDYWQSAYVHDEYQVTTKTELTQQMCKNLEDGANMVTQQFKTNIPIKADAGVGDNWSETH